jgi:3-oxoacyl-(acyl-carrier-protein) synthase
MWRAVPARLFSQPLIRQDERRMARFAQYAMVASEEALKDAGWKPKKEADLEATVQTPYAFCVCSAYMISRASTWALELAAWMMCMIPLWHTRKV